MTARKGSPPTPGRVAIAARRVLAETAESADPTDLATRALLVVVSGALDSAASKTESSYAVAALSGRVLDILRELRLTPASRGEVPEDDSLVLDLMAQLGGSALRDRAHP